MSPSAEDKETGKEKGKLRLVIILLSAVILLGGTALGYFIFFSPDNSQARESSEIYKITLDTFTVNLSDMQYRRYLRADITLELYTEEGLKEVELKKHRIRDKIITLLNHKSVSDIDSNQKVEKTRLELLNAINELVDENNQVKALYFENFIIQ